jgi:hypothetical protein
LIRSYSNGSKPLHEIYHAPDDITGSRTVAWDEYKPFSLDWVLSDSKNRESLTDALYQQLLELGRKIDEAFARELGRKIDKKFAPDRFSFALPYPRDIVKIDNKWLIQPFFLSPCSLNCNFKFEEYFKMLCGKENALTPQNWLDLIAYDEGVGILYDLIPDGMVPEVAAYIIQNRNIDVRERQGRATVRLGKALKKTQKFGPYLTDFR